VSQVQPASRRLWSDWVFERVPLPTPLPGLLLIGGLLVVLFVLGRATGALAHLEEQGISWWQSRDGRIATLLVLLAGAVPTALRYHEIGTRRDLDTLARSHLWGADPPTELSRATSGSPRAGLAFGMSGFLLVPCIALFVDGRPAFLYGDYWGFPPVWTWVVGFFVTFTGGVYAYRALADARAFGRLARGLPEVDLLEREALIPFARQGLRSAVPGALFVSFLTLNLVDEGFLLAVLLLGGLVLVQNVATLLIPLRGLRDRLRAAKREELRRVDAAIRGEPDALRGSMIGRRESPSLADLLAWRSFVQAVPEWPIDTGTLGRSAFFVGLPLLSWVGGALVERAVDLVIG
jgi:hypothetical protein